MSGLFQQVVFQLGAKQMKFSACHPESQGALERFHSTLKNMIRTYCFDNGKDQDEGISYYCLQLGSELGFSPFELGFGHSIHWPLKMLNEIWLSENTERLNLLDQQNLKNSQSQKSVFKPGDKVLGLMAIQGNTLKARYHGPYKVLKRVGDLDYVTETAEGRKSTQLYHVKMVKPYFERGVKRPVMVTDCKA